jgi:signal transduction histidine kinase/CheY-like chemotaxis protein
MKFAEIPPRLKAYVLLHLAVTAPLLWLAWQQPPPDSLPLLALLLAGAGVTGTWRIQLTVLQGRQSLVFAVVTLALLLQGLQAAVLCAALGALVTHLARPVEGSLRLQFAQMPLYRRLFNVSHCAVVCTLAGLSRVAAEPWLPGGAAGVMCGLVLFATVYFLLNSLGIATAIAWSQNASPLQIWKEHYFWTAPAHFASAAAAAAAWAIVQFLGIAVVFLLPAVYLVYGSSQSYVEMLRKERALSKEVERLYQQEEEANRRKDEFLATLAHELRNPLAAIANAHYLLSRAGTGSAQAPRYLDVIGRQTWHLKRMVDDLLDLSRITRGVVELCPELTDLRVPARSALESALPLIEGRAHRLSVRLPEKPLTAWGDPVRIEQIFSNLLTNAAKYTEPGGEIDVSLEVEDGEAVFRVRDSGIGIEPRLLPQVFDLFVQAESSLAHSQGGLGIGLTLVKNLAEMHEGRVEARSEGPGKGSEFFVTLPISDFGLRTSDLSDGPSQNPQAASRKPLSEQSARVLIVEDNEDAAESLAELLELWGYTPLIACDGREGLELVRRELPDAAILDLGLPEMDGYELASRIRKEFGPRMPLVALSGYGQQGAREASQRAGFDHHLVKPVDPEEIRRTLHVFLAGLAAGVPAAADEPPAADAALEPGAVPEPDAALR